jgi:phage tail sheath protein FI
MTTYRAPGVYFEWRDRLPPGIQPVRTDVAGFVGIARRGPLHTPQRVESWMAFRSIFGGHIPQGYLAYAVDGFFANGGRACWVVRVADPAKAATGSLLLLSEDEKQQLILRANSPGTWARSLLVSALLTGTGRFTLTLRLPGSVEEVFRDLSLDKAHERFAARVLNGELRGETGSRLVAAEAPAAEAPATEAPGPESVPAAVLRLGGTLQNARLAGGADGLRTLTPAHHSGRGAPPERLWGLATLERVREVAIVAMPDHIPAPYVTLPPEPQPPVNCDDPHAPPPPPPADTGATGPEFPAPFGREEIIELQRALIGHCELLKDRMAILTTPLADTEPMAAVAWRKLFDSSYAALYAPWLRVSDPLELDGLLRVVPPVGHVAGVYAGVENRLGVHRPPANERLQYVQDFTRAYDDRAHALLNENRVNALRAAPGRGLRILGARTLSSDSLWRYVNVRRLLIMMRRAIDAQTQWIVFEPNDPELWRDVDRVLRSFLNGLWQNGMLDGATAEEAYQVTCNVVSNPPEETEAGRLLAVIGVLPPWPAEFVTVSIGKTESGIEVLEV